jgi:hypothetical protein
MRYSKKKSINQLFRSKPSKEFVFLTLVPLFAFIPWIVSASPEWQYLIMITPTLYIGCAMLFVWSWRRGEEFGGLLEKKEAVISLLKFMRGER